jgi:hypothetical protein
VCSLTYLKQLKQCSRRCEGGACRQGCLPAAVVPSWPSMMAKPNVIVEHVVEKDSGSTVSECFTDLAT